MGEKMSGSDGAMMLVLGVILLCNLVSGIIGFIVGRATARRGPTKTIEVYEGPGVPF